MYRHLIFFLVLTLIFTELGVRWWAVDPADFKLADETTTAKTLNEPIYHEQFISHGKTNAVHAPAITSRSDGKLIAIWYAGSREGAGDVNTYQTIIDPADHSQSPPRAIDNRLDTQQDSWRYIRKLGNPVIHRLNDDRLMLTYVGVSFGGWAASRLYQRFSDDDGNSWSAASPLITSPFLNISTLVKGAPISYANGDIGLPVYHEFIGKFGEWLLINGKGQVKNKYRISWGRDNIQPYVAPLNKNRAIALLRDSGEQAKAVFISNSDNSGRNWTAPEPTSLPNPNAAIALVTTSTGQLLAVFNNHKEERYDMTLATSDDVGKTWIIRHHFDSGIPKPNEKFEFSYPYLVKDEQDGFHLVYTWHKKRIKYIHFNRAWLEQLP